MKNTLKRIVASLLVAVMLFGSAPIESLTGIDFDSLFAVEAEAAFKTWKGVYYPNNEKPGGIAANKDTTKHAYDSYWENWSQGASKYRFKANGENHWMKGGCRIVAYAKFLAEAGVVGSSFNPDALMEWAKNNNCINPISEKAGYANTGKIPVEYAKSLGVTGITWKKENLGTTDLKAQAQKVYDLIKDGKYIILGYSYTFTVDGKEVTKAHYCYVSREYSLSQGTAILSDSSSDWSTSTNLIHRLDTSPYTGAYKYQFMFVFDVNTEPHLAEMYSNNQLVNATAYSQKRPEGGNPGLFKEPYDLKENLIEEIKPGQQITVKGWVKNKKYGNKWYRVSYNGQEGWMWERWLTNFTQSPPSWDIDYYVAYKSANSYKARLDTLDGYSKLDTDAISVQGTINSPDRKITKVSAGIYLVNEGVGPHKNIYYKEDTPNSNTYTLTPGGTLDKAMSFKSLKPGTYTYVLNIELESSKIPLDQVGGYIVAETTFTVYDKNTSQETVKQNNDLAEKLANEYAVKLVSGLKELAFTKKTTNIVNPPAVPQQEGSGNAGSGSSGSTQSSVAVTKNYYPGMYRTTTADSLNVRTGPGSSYSKATSAIPKGTEIGVMEVSSNGWGKTVYNGVTGWVSLNNCTYVRDFAAIQKPGKVTVKYNSDKDIATGSIVNVSWNAINYADGYNVYLKNSDGTVAKSQTDVRGTSTYFTVDEAGAYYITVAAINSQHIGDESAPSASFTVHAPCTVTFKDWNGRTETRIARYGEAVSAPLPPTREGYTFIGWDKTFDHVTSDLTINAVYEIRSFTVKFVKTDSDGKTVVLKSEKVKYCESATPPEDTQPPEFRAFVGWSNSDYINVKGNVTVSAVYQWIDPQKPVGISNATATRINGGYTIEFDVSSTEAGVTHGRVIVSLKTAAGKQIVTTESAAFSLASNTQDKEMEIFVPSDDPASVAEIYVVESFGVAIPRSDVVKCKVNLNDQWSSWVDAEGGAWPDNTWEQRQSRTVYRYQTKSYTTSTSATKSGWTKYDTTYTKSTGSTYNQVSAVNTDAHVRKVSTTKENIYSTYYRYLHYTNGGYNEKTNKNVTWACSPYKGNTDDGYGPTNIGPHYYESATPLASQTSSTWNIKKYNATCSHSVTNKRYSCQTCLNTWFYNETTFQKVTGSKTKYHYEDYYYTYHFYKWSSWSAWTETVHKASDTKKVESKLQYRYKNNSLGVEDNSGVVRVASTVSSGLKDTDILLPNLKDYAGDDVMLYIYKYNEASDWTGEFIGQTAIDANGNYSFNFVLREEPTAETGDFMVSIGIEGCTGMINVGKLVAPNPEYKVVFKYSDPSNNTNEDIVLDEQVVEEGEPVVAPQHIEFEGYKFLGWNTDLSYVTEETMFVEYGEETEDKIITFKANYEPEEYVVVFIDWDNDSVIMKRYNYGENIVAPIIKTTEGHTALWEGLDMDNPVVTGDTVITAKHSKKVYEVNFYNYDGEIIDTQFVEYGSTAADVNVEDKDNYIFIDWEYTDDLFDNAIVEGDTIYAEDPVVNFYPVYIFSEKVVEPVSSLEDGTYPDVQTVELTCDTEGAVIYYTLDGTDPQTAVNDIDQIEKVFEYTGPITIDRSVTLKYYACAFEKNDSEVVTNYYAVNAGQTESAWMLQDDIPDYVTENTDDYEISSAQGYRYRDVIASSTYSEIANFEAQGWSNEGFEYGSWSDWLMEAPSLNDMAYEAETQQPEPELEVRYQYSRYKYFDPAKNEYVYSPTQVEGYECEYETIQLETKLSTAGYVSGTTTKYYLHNNEKWFNYELTEIEVVPDYMMYRYRLKVYTLKKWSAWTTDAPADNETRENESATVYRYTIPEMCVVKIVPDHSDFGVDTLTYIIEVNEYLLIDENDYTFEGYDFIGFFTDPEFTNYFNHKTTPISGAVTLYPKYQAHTFNVMFVDYDGTVLYEESVEYGQSASTSMFEDMEREGYVFIGWDYESLDFITSDVIATAQYVKKEEYCSVSLNYNRYSLMNGNSFQLVAEITPAECENKNLIWYSTDESVVTVSDDGFVTAVGEGDASIIVETEATGFVDECVVVVSTNPATSLCLIPGSKLGLDEENGLLRGVSNTDCTVESIKAEFMNTDLVFTDKNGNALEDTALAGTGTVISFSNGSKVVDEITIVVTGDMTGDGLVNNRDAAMITRYLVEKETADFAQMVAIDVNGDGYINNRDASMVSRYLVGKETI